MKSLVILLIVQCIVWADLDKSFWFDAAQQDLEDALKKQMNTNVAKNLVMVIGDGMGVSTTTAGRIYKGQQNPDLLGEEETLMWDRFPYVGLSKTYTTNTQTPDSAGTATAYHCGVKSKNGVIGVDDTIRKSDCSTTAGAAVPSILSWALEEGKSVGFVTTDSLFGGSPAPLYAHSANRKWTAYVPEEYQGQCKDIAAQLIDNEPGVNIQVMLGGGRRDMMPDGVADPEYPDEDGRRRDGRDLIKEWKINQERLNRKSAVVIDKVGFDAVNPAEIDYLLGTFERKRMQEESIRVINNTEPHISEMVEKAIQILSKNPNGFYLFVEGANIDPGHHGNRAHYALGETVALERAVDQVMAMTSPEDTTVVVSADHSHGFTIGGYSSRGPNILGLVDNFDDPGRNTDNLGNRFTIIQYATGPGYERAQREDLTEEQFDDNREERYLSNIPFDSATHTAEDVAIFASGPMSHLFAGVHEQNFIAHALAYAACIGPNKNHCNDRIMNSKSNEDMEDKSDKDNKYPSNSDAEDNSETNTEYSSENLEENSEEENDKNKSTKMSSKATSDKKTPINNHPRSYKSIQTENDYNSGSRVATSLLLLTCISTLCLSLF